MVLYDTVFSLSDNVIIFNFYSIFLHYISIILYNIAILYYFSQLYYATPIGYELRIKSLLLELIALLLPFCHGMSVWRKINV